MPMESPCSMREDLIVSKMKTKQFSKKYFSKQNIFYKTKFMLREGPCSMREDLIVSKRKTKQFSKKILFKTKHLF